MILPMKTAFPLLCVLATFAVVFCSSCSSCHALRLPSFYDSNMVLQRDMPFTLRGWEKEGAVVTAAFFPLNVSSTTTVTNSSGIWELPFPAVSGGGPYNLTVWSNSDLITLQNIMFGGT